MSKHNKVILCDLGGVLIELDWLPAAQNLFKTENSVSELKNKWISLSSTKEFESGQCDFETFFHDFKNETGYCKDLTQFKADFNSIIGPLKPDCKKILKKLKAFGTLAMLSNTNSLHIEMLKARTDMFAYFSDLFLSYEMGLVKPSKEIYKYVCKKLETLPENILFFDDSKPNIDSASELGIKAFLVNSPQEILKICEESF